MIKIYTVLYLLFLVNLSIAADCVWDKDVDYPADYPPLIMDLNSWVSVVPKMENDLRITRVAEGTELVLACPENTIEVLETEVAVGVCAGDKTILIDDQAFLLSELQCASKPKEDILKNLGSCGVGGEAHTIGFNVVGFGFYDLIEVCFDPVYESNLYSAHTIRGDSLEAKDIDSSRPSFKSDTGFFSVSANTCYEQASQITLMEDILGDSSVIDVGNSLYFARGHMTPDADFVTEQEQDATYYYINAAPQWQAFNNGNWKDLEADTRSLAISRSSNLQIWSGAWNVLNLNDINGNAVEIFLGLTQEKNVIPSPDVTWKVVYDPKTNEGAAVVGVNNPYLTSSPAPVCGSESFCGNLLWLSIDVTDYGAGATYCCTVQELRNAVGNAPDLGDAGLLIQ